MMVIRPAPTLLLPFHSMDEPGPANGPAKVLFALGSILAQGDHASHLCRSLTLSKTTSGGAEMRPVREMRKSEGRVETKIANNTTMTAMAMRMVGNILMP